MTTEPQRDGDAAQAARDGEQSDVADSDATYRVTLDREACEGIFACLVRDERFVEAADGLATIEREDEGAIDEASEPANGGADSTATVSADFGDENADAARQAADACPVDAISVEVIDGA